MAAPTLASRSRRPPQGPDTEDVVLARAIEFSQWAKRNARIIIIVAVLAAISIGGLIYYRTVQAERTASAAADFMVLEQTVPQLDAATGAADLQRFIATYDGTVYADEARVLLGQIHLQEGEAQQAVSVLEPAAGRAGRSPVGAQAGLLLGAAHAQLGNAEAAADAYLSVSRDARFEFERRQALEAAAVLRADAGNYAGAADLYRDLVGMTEEGTMERSVYEMRLAEVEHRAAAPQP
jgi:predicted negative regulator of RcsB-dependent stress response